VWARKSSSRIWIKRREKSRIKFHSRHRVCCRAGKSNPSFPRLATSISRPGNPVIKIRTNKYKQILSTLLISPSFQACEPRDKVFCKSNTKRFSSKNLRRTPFWESMCRNFSVLKPAG
jgi:hypothetical protein